MWVALWVWWESVELTKFDQIGESGVVDGARVWAYVIVFPEMVRVLEELARLALSGSVPVWSDPAKG